MKNILRITAAVIFVLTIPFTMIRAQEKKTEQKIKIITDDGSGKKVVIDTVFTGKSPDSLKLKDGSTVYIVQGSDDSHMMHGDGSKHIFVTSTADGKDGNKTSEITIIRSDSTTVSGGDVFFYNNDDNGNVHYKVISKSEQQGSGSDSKFVWVNDNDAADKTRFVIAKDDMVITIEGKDEAKTKKLADEIEKKLGVESEDEEGK